MSHIVVSNSHEMNRVCENNYIFARKIKPLGRRIFMKKIFVALCMVAFLAACDDSSSASAGPNDEPGVESSSSIEKGESSSSVIPGSDPESSSSVAESSSSDIQSDAKQSSSSEKSGKSSSSVNELVPFLVENPVLQLV